MDEEIDERRVRRVADLARLELDAVEARELAGELEAVLEHFARLREAEPGGRPGKWEARPVLGDLSPRLRADVPSPDALARTPAELAPDVREGFFVVPRLSAMDPAGEEDG